jgi:Rieske 2Fe-2S family protein
MSPALPARYYTDPDVHAQEIKQIFARSWQLVCHESDLVGPGARLSAKVADREVLVVRLEDGGLAGHLNVCRHRGARLVTTPEPEGKAIRCPYHGWTYKLDGRLVGAPEARRFACLDKPNLGLHPVRVESFLGFVFANLDPDATPLAQQLPGLAERIGRYLTDLAPITRDRIHDTAHAEVQPANWKVVFDNYLEGYHVPVAHPGLMRLLDYQRYGAELHENYALYESPLRETPWDNRLERLYQRMVAPMSGLRPEDERVWRYVAIYPNTMIDLYPDHVLAWSVLPNGVRSAVVPGAFYGRPGAGGRTRIAQRLNIRIGQLTNDEDVELVSRVQAGLSTPGYEMGPLSERESAVAWFADKVRADLEGDS